MNSDSLEKQFINRMRELLVSLPYDIKVLFEAISDENLPLEARHLASGAVIYCLSPSDPIPDSAGILGFVDDVVLTRLSLKRLLALGGEDVETYPQRFAEQFSNLDSDLELIKGFLGDSMNWLEHRIDTKLIRTRYKGKDATQYVEDEEAREFLYTEGLEFATEYEIDDEAVLRLHDGKSVLAVFNKRMQEESHRIK